MSSPRSDLLPLMRTALRDAGFDTRFSSIYWTYATGFPKAQNLSKAVDKHVGGGREVIAIDKALEGAYAGCQLKPAVEVIIVAMKPLSKKTYADQVLLNGHGCAWLDDCRIPYDSESDKNHREKDVAYRIENNIPPTKSNINNGVGAFVNSNNKGRFPANILCEDNVLNDGSIRPKSESGKQILLCATDSREYSRFFSLDAWFAERIKLLPKEAQKTFPWLIVPKPSKTERNKNLPTKPDLSYRPIGIAYNEYSGVHNKPNEPIHPTIKPLKLMMWLIILSSREGDVILDPFMGSGTTPLAAKMTHRQYKGIELEEEFFNISIKRVDEAQQSMDRFL